MLAESVSKAASGNDLAVDDDRFEAMIKDVNNDEDEDEMDGKRVYRRVRIRSSPPLFRLPTPSDHDHSLTIACPMFDVSKNRHLGLICASR